MTNNIELLSNTENFTIGTNSNLSEILANVVKIGTDTSNVTISIPQDISSSYNLILPVRQGASGESLVYGADGQLKWHDTTVLKQIVSVHGSSLSGNVVSTGTHDSPTYLDAYTANIRPMGENSKIFVQFKVNYHAALSASNQISFFIKKTDENGNTLATFTESLFGPYNGAGGFTGQYISNLIDEALTVNSISYQLGYKINGNVLASDVLGILGYDTSYNNTILLQEFEGSGSNATSIWNKGSDSNGLYYNEGTVHIGSTKNALYSQNTTGVALELSGNLVGTNASFSGEVYADIINAREGYFSSNTLYINNKPVLNEDADGNRTVNTDVIISDALNGLTIKSTGDNGSIILDSSGTGSIQLKGNVFTDGFSITGNVIGHVIGTVSSLSNFNTDELDEGLTRKYFSNSLVDNHLSGGTGVTYSNGSISIGQSVSINSNVQFNNVTIGGTLNSDDITGSNVTVSNDLVVSGNLNIAGNVTGTTFIGDGSQLTGITASGGSPTFDNLTVTNSGQSIISLESDTGIIQLLSEDTTSQRAYLYNGTTGDQDFTIDVSSSITNKGINFAFDGTSRMRIATENITLPDTNQVLGDRNTLTLKDHNGSDRVQISGIGAGENQGSVRCGRILNPSQDNDLFIGSGRGFDANNIELSDAHIMRIRSEYTNRWHVGISSRNNSNITVQFNPWAATARTGTWINTSDDRLKHNEEPITNATDTLMLLNPQLYDKTISKLDIDYHGEIPSTIPHKKEMGLIAQDVNAIEKLRPFVTYNSEGDLYGLDYISLFSLHMKATQELVARITALEATVASLS